MRFFLFADSAELSGELGGHSPDLRIEIGRSLISEREQMMIEVAEEAWRQDEARREAEEAGRGER